MSDTPSLKDFIETARLFRALSHPLRLAITCGLSLKPAPQGEIVAVMGRPQSTVAQHLAKLRRTGVITGKRVGAQVTFNLVDPAVNAVIEAICRHRHNALSKQITWEQLGDLDWNSI